MSYERWNIFGQHCELEPIRCVLEQSICERPSLCISVRFKYGITKYMAIGKLCHRYYRFKSSEFHVCVSTTCSVDVVLHHVLCLWVLCHSTRCKSVSLRGSRMVETLHVNIIFSQLHYCFNTHHYCDRHGSGYPP